MMGRIAQPGNTGFIGEICISGPGSERGLRLPRSAILRKSISWRQHLDRRTKSTHYRRDTVLKCASGPADVVKRRVTLKVISSQKRTGRLQAWGNFGSGPGSQPSATMRNLDDLFYVHATGNRTRTSARFRTRNSFVRTLHDLRYDLRNLPLLAG